jgi:hypothetical protein
MHTSPSHFSHPLPLLPQKIRFLFLTLQRALFLVRVPNFLLFSIIVPSLSSFLLYELTLTLLKYVHITANISVTQIRQHLILELDYEHIRNFSLLKRILIITLN